MTYYVHVNRNTINANTKHGTTEPVIRIQKGRYGRAQYAHEVVLPEGSRVRYSPHVSLLPCGARLVIVCPTEPEVIS